MVNDQRFILMAGSIFISAVFMIFGTSFTLNEPTLWELLLMFFASILQYIIFLVYNHRYTGINKIIWKNLQAFEKNKPMKMKFHTEIRCDDCRREKACKFNYEATRIRNWNRYIILFFLIVLWVIRIYFFLLTQGLHAG